MHSTSRPIFIINYNRVKIIKQSGDHNIIQIADRRGNNQNVQRVDYEMAQKLVEELMKQKKESQPSNPAGENEGNEKGEEDSKEESGDNEEVGQAAELMKETVLAEYKKARKTQLSKFGKVSLTAPNQDSMNKWIEPRNLDYASESEESESAAKSCKAKRNLKNEWNDVKK